MRRIVRGKERLVHRFRQPTFGAFLGVRLVPVVKRREIPLARLHTLTAHHTTLGHNLLRLARIAFNRISRTDLGTLLTARTYILVNLDNRYICHIFSP
jgi:hypothetical protein